MYERTICNSFSSWYWIDSVLSKPGKNFRISSLAIEDGYVNSCRIPHVHNTRYQSRRTSVHRSPSLSRLHQTPLNVCQASTARPQCSVCVFHGQKPNSRTLVLVYTVTHQTSRWMEIPWSKWTTSYTSAALSPPTAAVKLI